MERPEQWDSFPYPSVVDRRVWISFGGGPEGSVIALISEPGPIDTTGKGAVEITVYAALHGRWRSEDDAREAAALAADQVIREMEL